MEERKGEEETTDSRRGAGPGPEDTIKGLAICEESSL